MNRMLSCRSIKRFITINLVILFCATLQYYLPYLILVKNTFLLHMILYLTNDKPFLNEGIRSDVPYIYIIQGTLIDTISYISIKEYIATPTTSIHYELYWFIPLSFLFEIVFDFFHYWTHRFCHMSKWLYKNIHSIHHSTINLHAAASFRHHAMDLIITNVFPLVLSSLIIPLSTYTLTVLLWYKSIQEIGGHSGKVLKGSSFIQFKWLPELLGIALYSHNHNEHHRNPSVNFSKRFSIWDRMFGTFRE